MDFVRSVVTFMFTINAGHVFPPQQLELGLKKKIVYIVWRCPPLQEASSPWVPLNFPSFFHSTHPPDCFTPPPHTCASLCLSPPWGEGSELAGGVMSGWETRAWQGAICTVTPRTEITLCSLVRQSSLLPWNNVHTSADSTHHALTRPFHIAVPFSPASDPTALPFECESGTFLTGRLL